MRQLILVALGGAAGACARFWLSGIVARHVGESFPWGTLTVNATGALAIGLLAARMLTVDGVTEPWRETWLVFVVGALGSYTTVSSFSLQTLALVRVREGRRAAFYVVASVALCLGAAFVGLLGGARLFGG